MAYYDRFTQRVNNTNVTGTWTGLTTSRGVAGSTDNDGGVIRGGGTIASTRHTSKDIAENVNVTGPIVYNSSALAGNRKLVDKAVTAGSFATMTAGSYIIRRVTTTLAGVANTVLRSGASDFAIRRSIHFKEFATTSFLASFRWVSSTATPEVPGKTSPTYTLVINSHSTETADEVEFGQNSTATSPASQGTKDIAARPSLAVPGQLIYKGPKPNPVLDLYDAKTGG